jgi:hypothetical protein
LVLWELTIFVVAIALALFVINHLREPLKSPEVPKPQIIDFPLFRPLRFLFSFAAFVIGHFIATYRHLSEVVYPGVKEALKSWWGEGALPPRCESAAAAVREIARQVEELARE